MFKRILVPLDGSARAESALPVAARIARTYGGSVILLQVVETLREYGAYLKTIIDEEKADAQSYLKGVAKSDELAGVEVEVKVLAGAIGPTILETARTTHANLVVLCSHGYTGMQRWMLGSVSEQIARHAPLPVLILREGATLSMLSPQKPVRALVPLDGSPFSEAVFEPVSYLVSGLAYSVGQEGELHLLRVIDLPFTSGRLRSQAIIDTQTREQARQQAKDYLDRLSARLDEAGLEELNIAATTSVESDPDIAEVITRQAEGAGNEKGENGAFMLIAMATHGRGGMSQFVMGSVTERVLHHTKLPLLVVRPQKTATAPSSQAGQAGDEEMTGVESTGLGAPSWSGQL
jgi:nucleotide-binding universal stress UspA family protein